jgi:predicted nucleotidyltransferase
MAQQLVPAELLQSVVAHFRPQRVIVFGSVARGEAGADSDLDLLVVVDDDAPPEAFTAQSVHQARKNFHRAVDILPCRASVLGARASQGLFRRYRAPRRDHGV